MPCYTMSFNPFSPRPRSSPHGGSFDPEVYAVHSMLRHHICGALRAPESRTSTAWDYLRTIMPPTIVECCLNPSWGDPAQGHLNGEDRLQSHCFTVSTAPRIKQVRNKIRKLAELIYPSALSYGSQQIVETILPLIRLPYITRGVPCPVLWVCLTV